MLAKLSLGLRLLVTVVGESVLEDCRITKKELLGRIKKLKKVFVRKKLPIKTCFAVTSSVELRLFAVL